MNAPIVTTEASIVERSVHAMADRVRHHAVAVGAPLLEDERMVAAPLGDRGPFINAAVLLRPPTDWDATIEAIEAVIPRGTTATLVSAFATPDLGTAGWHLMGHPPLMVREPGSAVAPAVPADLRIHEVVDQPSLEVFERTLVDGYPMPDLQPYRWGGFFDERVLGGPTRCWIGFVGGRPVAVAAAHVAAGVNDVEMVATLDGYRGKGYGAAVTWAATTADPALPAVLIASDLGRPVYERLGYRFVEPWTLWLRP